MTIRTDLADAGIYIFRHWVLKLLEDLDKDHEIEISSIHVRDTINNIIFRKN